MATIPSTSRERCQDCGREEPDIYDLRLAWFVSGLSVEPHTQADWPGQHAERSGGAGRAGNLARREP